MSRNEISKYNAINLYFSSYRNKLYTGKLTNQSEGE